MLRDMGAIDLALIRSRLVFMALAGFQSHAQAGRQSEAGASISLAISLAAESLPVVERAVAEAQSAQAFDLTERTLARFFRPVPAEHAHAANDHAASFEQPSPTIA